MAGSHGISNAGDAAAALASYAEGSSLAFDVLVSQLADPAVKDETLLQHLKSLKNCVAKLGKEFEVLVGVIMKVDWMGRDAVVVREYQSFVKNLVSAHTVYLRACLRMLVKHMNPALPAPRPGAPREEVDADTRMKHNASFVQLHPLLRSILQLVPMAPTVLQPMLGECFPHLTKPCYLQECYVRNLLQIISYLPQARAAILELIIHRMSMLDVRSPRDEINQSEEHESDDEVDQDIFDMEGISNSVEQRMCHREADMLDVLMDHLLKYLEDCCYNQGELDWEATKKLYRDLLTVFENIILPTHASCHIQFLMFYICSLKEDLAVAFLEYLWKKVQDPNTQAVYRQACTAYTASLLARATYVSVRWLVEFLDRMVKFVHAYIVETADTHTKADVKHHGPFYSMCQAVFYVFAFRHKELIAMPKGYKYLQRLNLQTIVTSRLNPLRVCLPIVASTFSSVTRQHQLAYCDTILERNKRSLLPVAQDGSHPNQALTRLNPLDSFFPFDPYLLKRSSKYITPCYREFEGNLAMDDEQEASDEEDQYMDVGSASESAFVVGASLQYSKTATSASSPSTAADFLMYGVSPGFKRT